MAINKTGYSDPQLTGKRDIAVHSYKPNSYTTQATGKTHLFLYILNTTALTVVAFIAGYSLKGWQIQNATNSIMNKAAGYIQTAAEKEKNAAAMISELKQLEVRHIERSVSKTDESEYIPPETAEISDKTTLSITPTETTRSAKTDAGDITAKPTPDTNVVVERTEPIQKIDGVPVYHTVEKGEMLSMLVEKTNMDYVLSLNPHITNPNLIYPGQRIMLILPEVSIESGTYMNNYFLHPITTDSGDAGFKLLRWLRIPATETVLSFIIHQSGNRIQHPTIPFVNLAGFANTMKAEIFNNSVRILSAENKVRQIKKSYNGIYFQTIKADPFFTENQYAGIHLNTDYGFHTNIDKIKDFLIRYFAHLNAAGETDFFHYMIFDRTLVQTDYLEDKFFTSAEQKPKIRVAIVFPTPETENVLFGLQSALTTCKVESGEIAEINAANFDRLKN